MTNKNRFSKLVRNIPTELPPPGSKQPVSKSKSSLYTKVTVYLSVALKKRMQKTGIDKGMELSDMAEQAIEAWLSQLDDEATSQSDS